MAARIADAGDGRPENRTKFSTVYTNKEAADLLKVSECNVDKAKAFLATADTALVKLVEEPGSKLSLDAACKVAELPNYIPV